MPGQNARGVELIQRDNQFGDLERSALRPATCTAPMAGMVLKNQVVTRYQGKVSRIYFRADAAFAMPGVYVLRRTDRITDPVIRADQILQHRIGYLLSAGRPTSERGRRFYANFACPAGSWTHPRRVIAKVEWRAGELCPRVGFIVTNVARPPRMSSLSTTNAARCQSSG